MNLGCPKCLLGHLYNDSYYTGSTYYGDGKYVYHYRDRYWCRGCGFIAWDSKYYKDLHKIYEKKNQ